MLRSRCDFVHKMMGFPLKNADLPLKNVDFIIKIGDDVDGLYAVLGE